MMTDPIADMLTRIRNASKVRKPEVVVAFSRLKLTIAKILEREGYVEKAETVRAKTGAHDELKIVLRYKNGESAIQSVKRVSTPGRRMYLGYRDLTGRMHRGVAVLSTPKGVMTNLEARKQKIGGEIICEVY